MKLGDLYILWVLGINIHAGTTINVITRLGSVKFKNLLVENITFH